MSWWLPCPVWFNWKCWFFEAIERALWILGRNINNNNERSSIFSMHWYVDVLSSCIIVLYCSRYSRPTELFRIELYSCRPTELFCIELYFKLWYIQSIQRPEWTEVPEFVCGGSWSVSVVHWNISIRRRGWYGQRLYNSTLGRVDRHERHQQRH